MLRPGRPGRSVERVHPHSPPAAAAGRGHRAGVQDELCWIALWRACWEVPHVFLRGWKGGSRTLEVDGKNGEERSPTLGDGGGKAWWLLGDGRDGGRSLGPFSSISPLPGRSV